LVGRGICELVANARLEEIVDNFVEVYLKDHPVMILSLDTEIEDYLKGEELDKIKDRILLEYWGRKADDRKTKERLNKLNKGLYEEPKDSELGDCNLLQYYMQSIPDHFIREVTQLVLSSNNVRIRRFEELEDANLEDPTMPNEWIYHKDMNSTEASEYVRAYDDSNQDNDSDGW
jgi:hypothetical protein